MTSMLHLAPDLALPLEAVTQAFGILAQRGSGKTYTAAVLAEEMIGAGIPVAILDPLGVWWGLRVSADGKGPGLPVAVLGGEHGDLPLEATAGAVVAEVLVETRQPFVLDLSLFSKEKQRRFVTDFVRRLNEQNRLPLHVIVDEADLFAPQTRHHGQELMIGAMEDLVRRGRARGLGITLITQRPAVIHKDVLSQIGVLIALRMTGPQDRKAIEAWIALHGTAAERVTVLGSLGSLPVGTAWIWSPGWLEILQKVTIRARRTFDSSATPKMGERPVVPQALAPIDLGALRARMEATVERRAADDPAVLRGRIAELEAALAAARRNVPAPAIERVEVVPPATHELLRRLARGLSGIVSEIATELGRIAAVEEGALPRDRPPTAPPPTRPYTPAGASPAPLPARPSRAPRPEAPAPSMKPLIRPAKQRMIDTLARVHPTRLTRLELGALAAVVPAGGSFGTYLTQLKRDGLVDEQRGQLALTEAGRRRATPDLGRLLLPEVLVLWATAVRGAKSLRGGKRRMVDVVIAHPEGLTRPQLGVLARVEATGGSFGTYLSGAKATGLLEEARGGKVRPSSALRLVTGGGTRV